MGPISYSKNLLYYQKPEQKNINLPDIEKKRKEGGEGRVEESLSKLVSRRETNGRIDGKREETNAGWRQGISDAGMRVDTIKISVETGIMMMY